MEAGFVNTFDFRVSRYFISGQSVLSECRMFSWHRSLLKNKETTIKEWKQIEKVSRNIRAEEGERFRNILWEEWRRWRRLRKNMKMEPNVVEHFPVWAVVIMNNFHREPTESKPEVTERQAQANCLYSCLHLHPFLCGYGPSLSRLQLGHLRCCPPTQSSGHVRVFGGTSWTESQNRAPGARKHWLSPLHVRVKTQGGDAVVCLFRFQQLTWPPLLSAGSGWRP